jgi:hypothetical protein
MGASNSMNAEFIVNAIFIEAAPCTWGLPDCAKTPLLSINDMTPKNRVFLLLKSLVLLIDIKKTPKKKKKD